MSKVTTMPAVTTPTNETATNHTTTSNTNTTTNATTTNTDTNTTSTNTNTHENPAPTIIHIPPTVSHSSITEKRKVSAYARVSTDQDEQLSSYEAQVAYYTNYIKQNPAWQFAGIFADEGITGTSTKKREGFNRMLASARRGEIDLILTKSISRFARNTVDTLQTVRELKSIGVEVIFEKESLSTFNPQCEVMLTIMSSLAQEESRSISENVRWGKQKSMQKGHVPMSYTRSLGYAKGKDGKPIIVEEEAKIIRRIYQLYLDGYSYNSIAKILTEEHIPTPTKKDKWSVNTIRNILTNERYKGDALLQKTYTADYLSKKIRKNRGEHPQYYVKGSHPAIIEPAIFDKVQTEIERRTYPPIKELMGTAKAFKDKLICGDCGLAYCRHTKVYNYQPKKKQNQNNNSKDSKDGKNSKTNQGNQTTTPKSTIYWFCSHKYKGKAPHCVTPNLKDTQIKQAFKLVLKMMGYKSPHYTEERWNRLVHHVTVYRNNTLIFTMNSGAEYRIKLEEVQ